MRKLASIQYIWDIQPIKDAERIEVASVLGWKVVVKKEEFKVGDLAVYFEIDSFLPVDERYSFLNLRKHDVLGEGYRLDTVKLRGQISQGLLLPLSMFPEIENPQKGADVTALLGVRKWEDILAADMSDKAIGARPFWVEKTSETRIQAEPELLNEFKDLPYYITTKLDGASHFIAYDEEGIHFGSHNLELKADDSPASFYGLIKRFDLEAKLLQLYKEKKATRIYVCGEFCGARIQRNNLKLQNPMWYPFTINIDGKRQDMQTLIDIANFFGVPHVPIEETGANLLDKYPSVESLLERAKLNLCGIYPGKPEGIVIRPITPTYSETLGTDLSIKVINNEYLLRVPKDK